MNDPTQNAVNQITAGFVIVLFIAAITEASKVGEADPILL